VSRLRFATASVLAIVLGAAAIHCSLTTSLDGLAGGATPDGGDSAVTDALAADAPLGDAQALDSSAEAGSDSGRYCSSLGSTPVLCDDFDDEGPFIKWSGAKLGPGASVVRDRTASRSAPNSLLTTSAASANSIPAYLRLTSPSSVHRVRVAYDLRVDARDSQSAYAEVGYIRFGTAVRAHSFYLRLYGGVTPGAGFAAEAYLPDGGIPQNNVSLAGNPFTSWTRVEVDYDLGAAPHVSVTLDGVLAGDTALDPTRFKPDVATVEVGVGYSGPPSSSAWQLRYDNVTVDWDP